MRILTVGDVCGSIGCEKIVKTLSSLKKKNNIDMVIINGENSADGNGITPQSAESLFAAGADVITGGNHSLRRKEVFDYLDENEFVLRPDNLPSAECGKGYCLVDFGFISVAVINLSGKIYLDKLAASCPFEAADRLLEKARNDGAKITLVDFHAEATSEKRALGLYLDGKVSAVFGTHTHVQTADNQILPNGTGYITDLGMTGPINSILGVRSDIIINRLKDGDQSKFELADGDCCLSGCIFEIDNKTGKALSTKRIYIGA